MVWKGALGLRRLAFLRRTTGGTGGVVHCKGGLFHGRQHAVHGGSSLKPVATITPLARRDAVGASSKSGRGVGGLVPFPVLSSEPLAEGLRTGEMTTDPSHRDPCNDQGPEVGVRPVKQLCHAVQAISSCAVADIPGV